MTITIDLMPITYIFVGTLIVYVLSIAGFWIKIAYIDKG